jgi:hypothetical protein
MIIQTLFPFSAAAPTVKADSIDTLNALSPKSIFKPKALGLSFGNSSSLLSMAKGKRSQFEEPPYDFDQIIQAIDTDSYIKMAFSKYRELCWKEGWDIVSENPEAVDYLWQRIDLFEEVMGIPFTHFLASATDQYFKFGNAFIAIARGDIQPLFKGRLQVEEGYDHPISGFYLIPTETVRIYRDKFNRPLAYKQALDDYDPKGDHNAEPRWSADEVIHLHMDRKPQRAFGTPFIINVLDDVIALRQIEEDVQNLVHREMFPLYTYTVGTELSPSSPQEIIDAAEELANLRTEGGLVLPERHTVEVLGAEGNAMDVSKYLTMFTVRVITGMGLSPHHLGLMSEGGNRSVTDTLDKALYDRIKMYQRELEDFFRLKIFNPILREGGFDPLIAPAYNDQSDRCYFKFREIDIDSQVLKENHYVNLFVQNAITWEELRLKLSLDPEEKDGQLFMLMQHQLNVHLAAATAAMTPAPVGKPAGKTTPAVPAPKPKVDPASMKGLPNVPNISKGTQNKVTPKNQFGKRLSPNIRRIDDDRLNDIIEILGEE